MNDVSTPAEEPTAEELALVLRALEEADASANRILESMDRSHQLFQDCIAEVRSGSQRVAAGILETLALNGLSDEWLRARIPTLMGVAPKLAKFLLPAQKEELRDLTLQVVAVTDEPQVKKALQDFAGKLRN
jgi:hypothetical protein